MVLSLAWASIATVVATFYPLIEAWQVIFRVAAAVMPCIPGLRRFKQPASDVPAKPIQISPEEEPKAAALPENAY